MPILKQQCDTCERLSRVHSLKLRVAITSTGQETMASHLMQFQPGNGLEKNFTKNNYKIG